MLTISLYDPLTVHSEKARIVASPDHLPTVVVRGSLAWIRCGWPDSHGVPRYILAPVAFLPELEEDRDDLD